MNEMTCQIRRDARTSFLEGRGIAAAIEINLNAIEFGSAVTHQRFPYLASLFRKRRRGGSYREDFEEIPPPRGEGLVAEQVVKTPISEHVAVEFRTPTGKNVRGTNI